MDEDTIYELAHLFVTLGDKTRLRLLALIYGGEASVGFLADSLGESQPKVSRHLAYLRNAGLVSTRRDGKHIYYLIQHPENAAASHLLHTSIGLIFGGQYQEVLQEDQDIYVQPYVNEYNREGNELEVYLL